MLNKEKRFHKEHPIIVGVTISVVAGILLFLFAKLFSINHQPSISQVTSGSNNQVKIGHTISNSSFYKKSSSPKSLQTSPASESPKVPYYNQSFIGSWLINTQETEKRCIQENGKKANLDYKQIDPLIYYSDVYPHIKSIRDNIISDFRIKLFVNSTQKLIIEFIEPHSKSATFHGRFLQSMDRIEFINSSKKSFFIDILNKKLFSETIMLSGSLSELKDFSQISKLPCNSIILDKESTH